MQIMGNDVSCAKDVKSTESNIMDQRTPSGNALLCSVITEGDEKTAIYLVQNESKLISVQGKTGDFPLHLAMRGKQLELTKTMLEHGASANVRDKVHMNPLEIACSLGQPDFVELLLMYGAERKPQSMAAALRFAIEGGNAECIELLLKAGARPDAKDSFGTSALLRVLALGPESDELGLRLLRHILDSPIREAEEHGATHLSWAIYMDRCSIASAMLQQKPPNTVIDSDYQAILVAIDKGCMPCFTNIIKHKGEALILRKPPDNLPSALELALHYCSVFKLTNGKLVIDTVRGRQYYRINGERLKFAEVLIRDYDVDVKHVWFDYFLSKNMHPNTFRDPRTCGPLSLCISAFGGQAILPTDDVYYKQRTLFETLGQAGRYTLMMKLYEAGFTPHLGSVLAIHHEHDQNEQSMDIVDELNALSKMPRTLKNLAVIQIRCCLETNVIYKSKCLPLPDGLQKAVTLGY